MQLRNKHSRPIGDFRRSPTRSAAPSSALHAADLLVFGSVNSCSFDLVAPYQ